nr:hypothetical protein I308_00835 [Cryptococcus tetragattii IND107]
MASTWDIISSVLFLAIFIAAVCTSTPSGYSKSLRLTNPCFFLSDFVSKFAHLLDGQKTSTTTNLQSRGVSYDPTASRVKIQTNRAAPSREEYISNMQGAFKRGAHNIKAHSNAFAFKKGSPEGTPPPEKKGFVRTKKLD